MKHRCSFFGLDRLCRMRADLSLAIALSCILISGCRHGRRASDTEVNGLLSIETPSSRESCPKLSAPSSNQLLLVPIESDALQNLIQISDQIFSGGEPRGEDAFQELSRLGVQTVISVDGIRPDLVNAKGQGLRYVHIPIGYDGIEQEAARSIVKAMRETAGRIYIHCHHGRHRGPVAAAIAFMADGQVDPDDTLRILQVAGTSRDYAGLWRDVAAFRSPGAGVVLPELLEAAPVGDLAESMAKMDRVFDRLALLQANQWVSPGSQPDLDARQETLLLRELLHESGRLMGPGVSEDLQKRFAQAEGEVILLQEALKGVDLERATPLFNQIKSSCKSCHRQHRNDSKQVNQMGL